MFSAPILVMCGNTTEDLVQTRITLGLEAVFNNTKFCSKVNYIIRC